MSLLPVGFGASGGYPIQRSLRFRASASAYLRRVFSSASTDGRKWTASLWVKRGQLGSTQRIFSINPGGSGTDRIEFSFDTTDKLSYEDLRANVYVVQRTTTQVFRDPSAWYHIVLAYDSTPVTPTFKMYMNGVEITAFSASTQTAPQNSTDVIAGTVTWDIGRYHFTNIFPYLDGYLAEVNFIDGQALTPSSFGQTDATTGQWVAKKYTGTYGTKGFYLDFSDPTSATTLAYDRSGNGNNWTPTNISTTAGATYDSMLDVPSGNGWADGGNGRGNYCTLNPLANSAGAIANSNLRLSGTASAYTRCNPTMFVSSGKWYFEATLTTASTNTQIGIGQGTSITTFPGQDTLSYSYEAEAGNKYNNFVAVAYGSALISGDVLMCAFDLASNKIFFGKNGTWFASSDPATGVNPAYSISAGEYGVVARAYGAAAVVDFNFGQRPFAYTPPTGYKALHTGNLPAPTIALPNKHFDIKTRTGTGASANITGYQFKPDLVWIKSRGRAVDHALFDAVRGVQLMLESNQTGVESTETTGLTAFNSDGYTIGALDQINGTTATNSFVDWAWKAGNGTVSNTSGSITSTVSVNAAAGFSIVMYTGTGANATVGHGLGVAPKLVIVKNRQTAANWPVWHAALAGTDYLLLNTTAAKVTDASYWNSTIPTAIVFSLGSVGQTNNPSNLNIAYCFAEVPGFSKFGSYTGNGSTDGPFVFCGFRPRFILFKRTDAVNDWYIFDTARDTINVASGVLVPNTSNAETITAAFDFTSNGFKIRQSGTGLNASGGTYIFAAFAESPFKTANAR